MKPIRLSNRYVLIVDVFTQLLAKSLGKGINEASDDLRLFCLGKN
jgi:hypothetical protein